MLISRLAALAACGLATWTAAASGGLTTRADRDKSDSQTFLAGG